MLSLESEGHIMKFYPLADCPHREKESLGISTNEAIGRKNVHGIRTGEKRNSKKGEWYLSGAIPKGYRANRDLLSDYYILRLVKIETRTEKITTIVEV